ncbi:HNH endonuclease [Nonomuraea sp. NPDC050328]|uniref:HNH endonuclease n=1 Tax=Nonomuraea sp. NPDC050328 TaxID=3364361 RepID=UPI0037950421
MASEFFREEPTARASWRMAVLMGANSRTYKFALGDALLAAAASGRTEIPLDELAVPYSMSLATHLKLAPQAPATAVAGESDFLSVAEREAEESVRQGSPTELLLAAAIRSMPAMVMRKFHNLRGGGEIPHHFYEVTGPSRARLVRLTPHLRDVAQAEQTPNLRDELAARWSIVELSFAAEIGRSLVAEGFAVDAATSKLTDKRRRRPVTGVAEAVLGFQHGRCLICAEPLILGAEPVAVDHVFPWSFMRLLGSEGTDLDAVWNLAPAHAVCNARKSNRPPTPDELTRLARRNEAIMQSPHPLRQTLLLTLKRYRYTGRPGEWVSFIRFVRDSLR